MPLCRFPFQAFTMVAVFNSMTFALKVTPLAVRALSEGAVAVKRFQVRKKKSPKKRHPHTLLQHKTLLFVFSLLLSLCFLLVNLSSCLVYSSQLASPFWSIKTHRLAFVLL